MTFRTSAASIGVQPTPSSQTSARQCWSLGDVGRTGCRGSWPNREGADAKAVEVAAKPAARAAAIVREALGRAAGGRSARTSPDCSRRHDVAVTAPSPFPRQPSRLGRPRSTPCPMAAFNRREDSGRKWARRPIRAHLRCRSQGLRRPHATARTFALKVGALFCLLDIQMNSGHLVSRQMRQEDIHALLRSPQRGSITHFGYNEWRAAAGKAGRMPAHLDIRRLERARLRDHCDVEIANDPELLGCGQRRSRDETIDSVDVIRTSPASPRRHVPAIVGTPQTLS